MTTGSRVLRGGTAPGTFVTPGDVTPNGVPTPYGLVLRTQAANTGSTTKYSFLYRSRMSWAPSDKVSRLDQLVQCRLATHPFPPLELPYDEFLPRGGRNLVQEHPGARPGKGAPSRQHFFHE